MGSRLAYYLIILPISLLPYPLLYLKSDVFFILIYYVIGYRKKVVLENIQNSFPEKTEKQHREIMRKYYRHFMDLVFESLKGFTVSEHQIKKRFKWRNPEIINKYYDKGKDIILVGGHYNNWEMFAHGIGISVKHLPIGIYKPLSNKFFDHKMKSSRQRFRLKLFSMRNTGKSLETDFGEPNALLLMNDQSPSNNKKTYWTKFLNQDTALSFGTERYAKKYNRPVIYCTIHKVKRGFYEVEFKLITDDPQSMPDGYIVEMSARELEKDIIEMPEYWLWTHRRWKHKRQSAH
jgi:Kdo2-lipid IVA lauroyltransferase/acyltransferase